MAEVVKVVYVIKAERFFERGMHTDQAEFKKAIYEYIASQIQRCQLGHKIETEVVSQTVER